MITGHSLGGALATLFTADIAEFGMDAGRALPQLEPSQPWWTSLSNNFLSKDKGISIVTEEIPRPKSLRVYSFGSPRVGNKEFVAKFDSLVRDGSIQEAYRVVNDADIVARMPRSVNNLVGFVGYDHCGPTALISLPKLSKVNQDKKDGEEKLSYEDILEDVSTTSTSLLMWIEGESDDDRECPVRDGKRATSDPMASGTLLGDLYDAVKNAGSSSSTQMPIDKNSTSYTLSVASNYMNQLSSMASDITSSVSNPLQSFSVSDVTSIIGLNKNYTDREVKIIQSVFTGKALAHHMEDEYYQAMGRACGFMALVGKEIQSMDEIKKKLDEMDDKNFDDLYFLQDMKEEEDREIDIVLEDNTASMFS